MASVSYWTDTPISRPTSRLWGLRFAGRAAESDYRGWRVEHVRPFTRFAMYAATGAATLAWFAVLFGALDESRGLALLLIPVEIAILVVGALVSTSSRHNRWVVPASAGVNLVGGFLAVSMTYTLANVIATAACVTMVAYFGLTMYRIPPFVAVLTVTPYIVLAEVVAIRRYADGDVSRLDLVLSSFVIITALITGMVVNLAMEWITRQTFADHVVIEGQREALFEERTNMAKFLSPQVADTIHERGLAATLGTRMQSLTAVSIDLRGFTHYTKIHGAAQMAIVLRDYYETVIEASREFGGTIKDFAGDGALILVGAPIQRNDHPRAGLKLARELHLLVREVTDRHSLPGTPLGVGVGVASGECAVGAIGSLSQLEYTAVGTAVNLSARLCDLAEHGQIVMGASTASALDESPGWRRDLIMVPGLEDPVEVTIEDTLADPDSLLVED
jgi:class 3 adenylate cyclase